MPAALALTVAALGTFLLFTALGVGSSTRTAPPAPYTLTPFATYSAAAPHVVSKLLFNSVQGRVSGAAATPPSALPPVPAVGVRAGRSPSTASMPSTSSA